jgi:hypothetical protein
MSNYGNFVGEAFNPRKRSPPPPPIYINVTNGSSMLVAYYNPKTLMACFEDKF